MAFKQIGENIRYDVVGTKLVVECDLSVPGSENKQGNIGIAATAFAGEILDVTRSGFPVKLSMYVSEHHGAVPGSKKRGSASADNAAIAQLQADLAEQRKVTAALLAHLQGKPAANAPVSVAPNGNGNGNGKPAAVAVAKPVTNGPTAGPLAVTRSKG